VSKAGVSNVATHVIRPDYGKRFECDPKEMRLGKVVALAQTSGFISPAAEAQ
jgi:hypothetical protein